MAVPIFFQAININQLDTASSFLIGQNFHCNVTSTRKQNYGNGELIGISSVAASFSNIVDPDGVDNPILIPEVTPLSPQNQVL